MNQSGFQRSKVYNYGLSSLDIQDYNDYISYAVDQNGNLLTKSISNCITIRLLHLQKYQVMCFLK